MERLWPAVIAVAVVLLIYRRLRRNFGRQRIQPVRMGLRVGILTVLALSLLPATLRSAASAVAVMAGLVAGVLLGIWGARRTRFQTQAGSLYYIPHTYTGVAVTLLLVGRMVYRFIELQAGGAMSAPVLDAAATRGYSPGFAPAMLVRTPATAAILFTVIGYYVFYYSWVLWKRKHVSPEDLEALPASSAAAS
jgi:hypothetical protein